MVILRNVYDIILLVCLDHFGCVLALCLHIHLFIVNERSLKKLDFIALIIR